MVHALVTCRLDLNNALLVGFPQRLVTRVNSALPEHHGSYCHLPEEDLPHHANPHETPLAPSGIPDTIYKVLLHVHRALNSQSPGYLASMLERHVPVCSLRSTDSML